MKERVPAQSTADSKQKKEEQLAQFLFPQQLPVKKTKLLLELFLKTNTANSSPASVTCCSRGGSQPGRLPSIFSPAVSCNLFFPVPLTKLSPCPPRRQEPRQYFGLIHNNRCHFRGDATQYILFLSHCTPEALVWNATMSQISRQHPSYNDQLQCFSQNSFLKMYVPQGGRQPVFITSHRFHMSSLSSRVSAMFLFSKPLLYPFLHVAFFPLQFLSLNCFLNIPGR